MKATQLLDGLCVAGLSDDEARNIVKGKIAGGSIEDDLTSEIASTDFTADVVAVETAAAAIAKAMDMGATPKSKSNKEGDEAAVGGHPEMNTAVQKDMSAEEGEEEEEEEEGEAEPEGEEQYKSQTVTSDDYDVVAIISKGADQILDSVENQNSLLAKGYVKVTGAVSSMAKAIERQSARYDDLQEKFDNVLKALGQPVPPKAVTGMHEAVPAPGETLLAKAGTSSREAVIAKANEELQTSSTDAVRTHELAMAVAELDSGADPEAIQARYSINIG